MRAESMETYCAPPLRSRGADGRHSGIFYGWWVVLMSAVGLFWGVPVSVYSIRMFLRPLMPEFHASRGAISRAFTVHVIAGATTAPLLRARRTRRAGNRRKSLGRCVPMNLWRDARDEFRTRKSNLNGGSY